MRLNFFSDGDDVRSLRSAGNIAGQALARRPQVVFADDVVAVEDGAGLVTGDAHGHFVTDAGTDQIPGDGPSQVMKICDYSAYRILILRTAALTAFLEKG